LVFHAVHETGGKNPRVPITLIGKSKTMISIGVPLFIFGGVIGYWIFRKKEVPVRVIAGVVCGCCIVGVFLTAIILGGDH
jgi:hypothetical protein